MVLDSSDYSIPAPGDTWDPTNPRDFLGKAAGTVVVLTFLAFMVNFATNRGLPFLNGLLGNVGLSAEGGDLSEFP